MNIEDLRNTVWHADCLEKMQDIPDESIDAIITDLPFGVLASKWDIIIPFEPLWEQFERIIKDKSAIVLFGSEPFSSKLRLSKLNLYRYDWKWNKLKPSNFQLMNFQCGRIHEDIMVFSKAKAVYSSNGNIMNYYPQKDKLDKPRHVKKTMYGTKNSTLREGHTIKELGERTYTHKLPKSIIEFSNANIKEKKHPTEKPLDLYKYLLSTYSKEGEIVLDCCAGSGNLGIAALQLKRDYILIEKDEKYFNIIQQRLKENKEVADDK